MYFGRRVAKILRIDEAGATVEAPSGTPNETVDVKLVYEGGVEQTMTAAFTYTK